MKTIQVTELKAKMDEKKVLLLDVREPQEYQEEYIEGSCHIPLGQVCLENIPSTTGMIVVHCRSGKRSEAACNRLLEENPDLDIYNLEGGILAWKEAGFETKSLLPSGKSSRLSLSQQVQILQGSFIFWGYLLGTYYDPLYYGVCGFFGLALIFVGVTGWCLGEKILARMPWNKIG